MAASTARAYPNPAPASSHFSLRTLVETSSWPPTYRLLLLAMLDKNKFGTELFRSTKNLAIALGVSYSTVQRMLDRLENGAQFGKKNRVECEPVLSLLYEANSRPGGKLRRQRTYQLCHTRLHPRRTERDFEDSSRGALCPLPPRSEHASSPLPPPPAPAPARPAEHRSALRSQALQPKLTKRECAKLAADIVYYMRGASGSMQRMNFRAAFELVCASWKREPEAAIEALKFWRYKFEESEQGP